jgi:CRISPR-associated nuclease/helicase Cas3-like protein
MICVGPASDPRDSPWLSAWAKTGRDLQALKCAPGLLDVMRERGLRVKPELADDPARSQVRHEFVGQIAVREWLADELGFPYRAAAAQLAGVVGGHHGVPPESGDLALTRERTDLARAGEWRQARTSVLRWAAVTGPAHRQRDHG